MPTPKKKPYGYIIAFLLVFAAYVLTGKIGLSFEAVGGFASLVWPPTGIAIAVMLLYGKKYWPAVALGALVVNLTAGAPLGSAMGMAAGNTLEALAAAWLLGLDGRFRHTLEDPRSVFSFVGLAAGLSTLISATIGTTSLWLGGVIPAERYAATWTAWWVGDVFGALIVAPFLLVWLGRKLSLDRLGAKIMEIGYMAVIFAGIAALMFGGLDSSIISPTAASYIMMIPLVWAGVRFGMRGSATAIMAFAFISVYGTALGKGPFAAGDLNEGIAALHLFIGTSAIMSLFLGSAHDERIRADRERTALMDELEEQARYLKAIIELAPVGIKLLDRESRVRQINPAGLRMIEAESEHELVDKPMLSLTEADDRPAFAALLKKVFEGGSGGMRHAVKGMRGGRRVLDAKMVPFRDADGKVTAALAMFDDKTHEVEQERQLKAGRAEMEQLNRTVVNRELKMIELKKDLKDLRGGSGADAETRREER
ncbi:MAG TPA: MASE1 domain-containing protein [Candidatus Baltobacteraceae bacterium]|nr:MASE1 domain-containing protein [Candidatus Baltobacteraceae bacterium]